MRPDRPSLTDEDLRRLARLGGAVEQIAEAAGLDPDQVRRRLAAPESQDRTATSCEVHPGVRVRSSVLSTLPG